MRHLVTVTLVLAVVLSGVAPAVAVSDRDGSGPQVAAQTDAADGTDAQNGTDANATKNVTVLAYNDIQTAMAEPEKMGRFATLVNQRRAAAEGSVLVGGGDTLGPHALSALASWELPVAVMNELDPTADAVQNHELDYGLAAFSNATAASEFPWLAANVVNESTGESFDGTENYTVVERNGVRIGVFGVADGAIEGKTNIDFAEEGLEVRPYEEVGPRVAERLKTEENVDVVVALAPMGIPDAKRLAEADTADNIDVIVSGDDEVVYEPTETAGSVIVEAGGRADYLAEVNLTVREGSVADWNGRLVENTENVTVDESVANVVRDYRNDTLDTVIGETTTKLDARFSSNYHRETGYGNLVTDAMRNETGADVAVTNAGGIRSDAVYGPGNLTAGDVYNTLPFANTLTTVRLNGTELRAVLASQVVTMESETGAEYGAEISQQVSGVRFEWVPHEDAEPKIRDVYVNSAGPTEEANWTRLDADENYTVAVNSFIASGGSGYPLENATRVSESDTLLAEAVTEYVRERGTVSPAVEGRMRRVDAPVRNATVSVDERTTVTLDAPSNTTGVNASGFYALNEAGARVNATGAELTDDGERIVVRFDTVELASTAFVSDDVDLYGAYADGDYEPRRVYFDHSVLNVDFETLEPASAPADGNDANESASPGESENAAEGANPGDGPAENASDTAENATNRSAVTVPAA